MIRPGIRRLFRLPVRPGSLAEQELDEELELHLDLRAEQLERQGLSPAAAREEARRRFGPMDEARQALRRAARRREQRIDARERLAAIGLDLRYGWRHLRSSPGFTLMAVLTLALGIGANTALFSLVDATLLRPPEHVREPERLVTIYTSDFSGPAFGTSSYPDYLDFRAGATALSSLAAAGPRSLTISTQDGAEIVRGQLVTGNYFELLGVEPAVGRLLTATEGEVPGRDPVVVLSYRLWRRSFDSDPAVVGRTIRVNSQPLTVVGVTPEGFAGPTGRGAAELWAPIGMEALLLGESSRLESRPSRWLEIVGRLAPAASAGAASFQLNALAQRIFEQDPEAWRDVRGSSRSVTVLPSVRTWVAPGAREGVVGFLALITALVGLVLLIACANVANLLLARSLRRRREIAVRVALGASRQRIVTQLLVENLLLAGLGGAVGIALAVWITGWVRGLDGLLPLPLSLDLRVDGRVLAFALLISLATALLFGLLPALLTARQQPVPVLKEDAGLGGRRGATIRGVLISGQVAICAVLLVCAAMMVQSLRNATSTDLGFDPEGILLVPVQLGSGLSEAQIGATYQRVGERVGALPGVDAVALAEVVPLSNRYQRMPVEPEGYAPRQGEDMEIDFNVVSPGYFEMMEIPLLLGRTPTEADRAGAPPIAVVNEAFAARFWPGEQALGRHFLIAGPDVSLEVVGIARDGKLRALDEDPRPAFWVPLAQLPRGGLTLHVHTTGDPAALLGPVRAAVTAVDPDIPTTGALPLERAVAGQVIALRTASSLFAAFGLLALAIAMIGLYGVLAYTVSRRAREFGVRIALGAQATRIVRGVVWEGVSLVAAGAAVGMVGALLAARGIAGFLFGVSPTEPAGFLGISLLLLLVAAVASYIPARRATRVDPLVALRSE